jgi:hypothetical protein
VWNERSYPGGLTAFRAPELTRDLARAAVRGSRPPGLTAFRAPELTREAIFEALRNRRVYGTTQPDRVLVEFPVNGTGVGEDEGEVTVGAPDAERRVAFEVAGTAPLDRVTVVKNDTDWHVRGVTDDPAAGLDAYRASGEVTDDAPV